MLKAIMEELKRQVNREIRKKLERKQLALFEKRERGRRDLDRIYEQLVDDIDRLKRQEQKRQPWCCIIL